MPQAVTPRLLITGASGQLGAYLLRALQGRTPSVLAWSGSRQGQLFGFPLHCIDLSNPTEVRRRFREASPQVIIHAAAMARLGDCLNNPERAHAVNARAAGLLAEEAGRAEARLIHVSTDLVFDGEQAPYREEAQPLPLSLYGRTKAEAEQLVLAHPGTLVVRVSLLFGPSRNGQPSFFDQQMDALRGGQSVTLFADEWRTPLALTTAARALLELAGSSRTGILHLGGPERLSRLEMGQRLAAFLGLPKERITAALRPTTGEPRPRDVALDSSRWRSLFPDQPWPRLEQALDEMLTAPDSGAAGAFNSSPKR